MTPDPVPPPDRRALASSYAPVAAQYDRARPGYPDEAVDWMLPAGARRVVDLGAGTGKLTRSLDARGLDVVAVEPDDAMRAVLHAALPRVEALAGSAEDIPLGDGRVDAVLVAQAWHWMDEEAAIPGIARVLRPGGRLCVVWNAMWSREPWVGELAALIPGGPVTSPAAPGPFPGFGPVEHASFRHEHVMGPDDVVDLVGSISFVILMPDADRARLLDDVRTLFAAHPDTAGRDELRLPYRADCYRAELGG